jgi:hypothetical protein
LTTAYANLARLVCGISLQLISIWGVGLAFDGGDQQRRPAFDNLWIANLENPSIVTPEDFIQDFSVHERRLIDLDGLAEFRVFANGIYLIDLNLQKIQWLRRMGFRYLPMDFTNRLDLYVGRCVIRRVNADQP